MVKYIDADKLLAEIKFAKSAYSHPNRVIHGVADGFRQDGRAAMCDDILKKIDSLQQEQPEGDLERDIDRVIADYSFVKAVDSDGFKVTIDNAKIARHFYELGQKDAANKYDEIEYNRQRAEEESLGKTLDEAAHQYAWNKQEHHIDFDGDEYLDYGPRYDAFIAGAKWMAGQGKTLKVTDDTTWGEVNDFIHGNCDGAKEIQIRKKED